MNAVRHCPSPTGNLHIGTLRTMLYNYLYAKKNKLDIVFRIEDTDKERSTKAFEENITSSVIDMGLINKNVNIYRQSERSSIYKKYLEKLLESGDAYYCFMTKDELSKEREEQRINKLPPRYSGKYRGYPLEKANERLKNGERAVIRFKTPENIDIEFDDLIRGKTITNSREVQDFVIAKDLNSPLYNFVVVVDDHLMGISHVLRGEDHAPNTPKQVLIYNALGFEIPKFAHFPLILNSDKSKLSKRKNDVFGLLIVCVVCDAVVVTTVGALYVDSL